MDAETRRNLSRLESEFEDKFTKEINSLQDEINSLKKEIKKLKSELNIVRTSLKLHKQFHPNNSNHDI